MHILSVPIVESLPECPTIRSGPNKLPSDTFRAVLFPLRWAAYWYRDHAWCTDVECGCRERTLNVDGRCVLAYENGLFGCFDLVRWDATEEAARAFREGTDDAPAPWSVIEATAYRIDAAPAEVAVPEAVQQELVAGIRAALEHAKALGWLSTADSAPAPGARRSGRRAAAG